MHSKGTASDENMANGWTMIQPSTGKVVSVLHAQNCQTTEPFARLICGMAVMKICEGQVLLVAAAMTWGRANCTGQAMALTRLHRGRYLHGERYAAFHWPP